MEVQVLKDLFLEALAVPPGERAAWLSLQCPDDDGLRQQLESMLQAHAAPQNLLDLGVVPVLRSAREKNAGEAFLPIGSLLGPYKLLEQIGEGGFGIVYMAQQTQPVRRKVALKVVKPGMDTRQVVARFEAERQALAIMDHPNIAHVFDGGVTPCGRPYFVMELVKGMPITEFCDQNQLTPRQRLELFLPVCLAIQHAHQKGIIHRDLKPSNVLVTIHDTAPVIKVIDFGIAKALGQELTDKTLFTGFAQLVGTPLYMSPEQAGHSSLDIDTRSDIYSLGVLLYELLTGTTPLDKLRLKQAAYDEICRIIREEEPSPPSTRLMESKQTLQSLSAQRQTEPNRLTRLVRGELDWIVMKALEKDRTRRYASAGELMGDLQRYLSDEPVLAHPPSALYRLQKLMRRHVGAVAAASLILLTLIGGIVGTTLGLWRAEHALKAEAERAEGERRAKEDAQMRLAQVEKGTEILAAIFRDFDPIVAEKQGLSSHDLLCRRLVEAAQQLDGTAVGNPLAVARLQHLLGVSLRELGRYDEAETVLVKACQTRERLLGRNDLDTATTMHHLAMVYRRKMSYELAEELFNAVVDIRSSQLGGNHLDTLATLHQLAALYQVQKKYDLAEPLCKEVLALRTLKLGAEDLDTLATRHLLAVIYFEQGEYALAEPLYQEVLAIRNTRLGLYHPDNLRTRRHLASLYQAQKKYGQAAELLRNLAADQAPRLGADNPETLSTESALGVLYLEDGKLSLAAPFYRKALEAQVERVGVDHVETSLSRDELAHIYARMKDFDRAIPLLEESLKYRESQLSADDPEILGRRATLGANYCDAGHFEKGLPLIEQVRDKKVQDPHPAWVRTVLIQAYLQAGKRLEAAALIRERAQEALGALPVDSAERATSLVDNGKLFIEAKEFDAGQSLLLEAHDVLQQLHRGESKLDEQLKETRTALVQLYDAWDQAEKASEWRMKLESKSAASGK